jgi:hypothetical protein
MQARRAQSCAHRFPAFACWRAERVGQPWNGHVRFLVCGRVVCESLQQWADGAWFLQLESVLHTSLQLGNCAACFLAAGKVHAVNERIRKACEQVRMGGPRIRLPVSDGEGSLRPTSARNTRVRGSTRLARACGALGGQRSFIRHYKLVCSVPHVMIARRRRLCACVLQHNLRGCACVLQHNYAPKESA